MAGIVSTGGRDTRGRKITNHVRYPLSYLGCRTGPLSQALRSGVTHAPRKLTKLLATLLAERIGKTRKQPPSISMVDPSGLKRKNHEEPIGTSRKTHNPKVASSNLAPATNRMCLVAVCGCLSGSRRGHRIRRKAGNHRSAPTTRPHPTSTRSLLDSRRAAAYTSEPQAIVQLEIDSKATPGSRPKTP
jgi:hypothetical protein